MDGGVAVVADRVGHQRAKDAVAGGRSVNGQVRIGGVDVGVQRATTADIHRGAMPVVVRRGEHVDVEVGRQVAGVGDAAAGEVDVAGHVDVDRHAGQVDLRAVEITDVVRAGGDVD